MNLFQNKKVRNAFFIGVLCSVSYLAVYFARNILSAVTPQMMEGGRYSTVYIGKVSSAYFIFYAIGQLINGAIGDKIKAKFMISFGLIFAGVCNIVFPILPPSSVSALVVYAMSGFFLSMIYGPMTKVVAENTEPIYATRCSLGYTFSSFFGSPLAGLFASLLAWQTVFSVSSIALFVMGITCFFVFWLFEKSGIVKYNQFQPKKNGKGNIKILIQQSIVKFTLISILTGVIRTTVVFWLPTYISQYLGFSSEQSASVFTIATLVISFTTFIAVFLYERLHHNMDLTILIGFSVSALSFLLVFFLKQSILNILFMVLAIMANNIAATMLWSRYCPSLRDTGMVSGATGFLDFVSYMSASVSSTIFADAVDRMGWGSLILIWCGLMVIGIIVSLPRKKKIID